MRSKENPQVLIFLIQAATHSAQRSLIFSRLSLSQAVSGSKASFMCSGEVGIFTISGLLRKGNAFGFVNAGDKGSHVAEAQGATRWLGFRE